MKRVQILELDRLSLILFRTFVILLLMRLSYPEFYKTYAETDLYIMLFVAFLVISFTAAKFFFYEDQGGQHGTKA